MSSRAKGFVSLSLLFVWTWLGSCFCNLVLPASQFQDIIDDVGVTSMIYKASPGHSLSLVSGDRRGKILKDLCRKELAKMHPNSRIQDAVRGACCNGQQRGAHQAEYDFSIGKKRIECKSSFMKWSARSQEWQVLFYMVKLPWAGIRERASFDDLYLILVTPDHVDIIKHDLETFLFKHATSSSYRVHIAGSRKQECWKIAYDQILEKLLGRESRCSLVAQVDLSNPQVQSWISKSLRTASTPQDDAYNRIPLSGMTSALRDPANCAKIRCDSPSR